MLSCNGILWITVDRQNILEKNLYKLGKVWGHEEREAEEAKEEKVDTWQGIQFNDNFRIQIALFSISLDFIKSN